MTFQRLFFLEFTWIFQILVWIYLLILLFNERKFANKQKGYVSF